MTTKDEALKLALAFIENTAKFIPHIYDALGIAVCSAIREALSEQPAQEPVAWMVDVDLANYQGQSEYRTILAWIAKPVWSGTHEINEVLKAVPLYTTPPAAQPADEPVACGYDETTGNCTMNPCCYNRPQEFVCSTGLCHYKAQREWVGLTDEEMRTEFESWVVHTFGMEFNQFEKSSDGTYLRGLVREYWGCWKAAHGIGEKK